MLPEHWANGSLPPAGSPLGAGAYNGHGRWANACAYDPSIAHLVQADSNKVKILVVYLLLGTCMVLTNGVLCVSLWRRRLLSDGQRHKLFALWFALAVADVLNGATFFAAGFYRCASAGYECTCDECGVSPVACLASPSALFLFTSPFASLMMFCVSLDRLLVVAQPLEYTFKYTMGYAYAMVATVALGPAIALAGIFIVLICTVAPHYTPVVEPTCYTTSMMGHVAPKALYYLAKVVPGIYIVIVYAMIPLMNKRMYERFAEGSVDMNEAAIKKEVAHQRRLNWTTAYSSTATVLLHLVPNVVRLVALFMQEFYGDLEHMYHADVRMWMPLLQNINPCLNVFIYTLRHREIRRAVVDTLLCCCGGQRNRVAASAAAARRHRTTQSTYMSNGAQSAGGHSDHSQPAVLAISKNILIIPIDIDA